MTRFPYLYPFRDEEGSRQPKVDWAILILLILLIVAVIVIAPRTLIVPTGGYNTPGEISTYDNPELTMFRRYQWDRQIGNAPTLQTWNGLNQFLISVSPNFGRLDSSFLAQNPEVGLYRRYLAEQH